MSFEIDEKTGCITKWKIPHFGEVKFLGSGCEFTDWFSFFAHERLGGFGIKFKNMGISYNESKAWSKWDVKMKKGHFIAETAIEARSPTLLIQSLKLVASPSKSLSWLGDAVIRFVLPLEEGVKAKIEEGLFEHKNSDTMMETERKEIELCWPNGNTLKFRWSDGFPKCPISMTPYLYARDQPARPKDGHKHSSVDAWVLHARILTEMPAAFVFRFFRNPGVIWDRPKIYKILFNRLNLYKYWRAGEFKVAHRKQTQGLWPFKPGESIELSAELEAIIS